MGFEFGKNKADIEICGQTYQVDPFASNVLKGLTAYRATLEKLAGDSEHSAEAVDKACAAVAEFIDAVLGAGAYAAAFTGREPNFLDHQELAAYLMSTVEAFRIKRVTEFAAGGLTRAKEIIGG